MFPFLTKSCIFGVLIICFSLLKVFEPYTGIELPVKQSILLLELCSFFFLVPLGKELLKNHKHFMYIFLVCILGAVLVGTSLYHSVLVKGMSTHVALFYAASYIYIFLLLPIGYLLILKGWELRKLLFFIILFSVISYSIRIFISKYEGAMGVVLFPGIALEDAKAGWRRNGVLRVNPPAMVNIFIPIAAYMMFEVKKSWKKLFFLGAILLALAFTFEIHQARSVLIYQTITVLLIYFLKRKPGKKELLAWLCVGILLLFTPQLQHFFESLSLSYKGANSTTQVRVEAINYFFNLFKETPIFGIGFLDGADALVPGGGHIADIGILGTIFLTGIPGLCIFLTILIRGVWVSYKGLRAHWGTNEMILVVSMTAGFWLTNINIDCFGALLAISTPFYLAIVEFVNYRFDRGDEL